MLGFHIDKVAPEIQRQHANGLPIFQCNFGSPQSYLVPYEFLNKPYHYDKVTPVWFWHSPYVATAKPADKRTEATAHIFRNMIRAAEWWKVSGIVVHTGASTGLKGVDVLSVMMDYLGQFEDSLIERGTKLLVELGASISQFNSCPQLIGRATRDSEAFGWVLDLHHCYAAGIQWKTLRQIIEDYPPTLCHCNFPGTVFASSRDYHGWRTSSHLYKDGKAVKERDATELCKEWDETIRLLKSLGVPMIIEGSGLPGNPKDEYEFIRSL